MISQLALRSDEPFLSFSKSHGMLIKAKHLDFIGQCYPQCDICLGEMRIWELGEHVGTSCEHQFCATCWERYLTLKIQEGGAHHILCPAVRCNILVDVDFIEKMVSPEMARKYLQFDIQVSVVVSL